MPEATNPFVLDKLDLQGRHFVDPASGRVVQFRGINLGGGSKLPVGWTTSDKGTAFDIDKLTFVGKPFKLDEAEEHCKRLKYWGLSLIRLIVTWESIEHKGPGAYDEEHIEYLISLLKLFKKYGLRCFIDPHQDCWSRLCGGSGAPNWTLYIAGFDPRHFAVTGAAINQFEHDPPEEFPIMTWPTNYAKLATATMFTLFFGGATFAPKCNITLKNGSQENIQHFLQRTFCEAYEHLFRRFKEANLLDNVVIGMETLNEPSEGFIETEKISTLPLISLTSTRNGACPTALQAMILGQGIKCEVDKFNLGTLGFVKQGTMTIDPEGTKAWFIEGKSTRPSLQFPPWSDWQTNGNCIWAYNGVWDPQTKTALKDTHFSINPETNKKYEFLVDFWKPFVRRVTRTIQSVHQDSIIFIEPPVNIKPPKFSAQEGDPTHRVVYAPHWYDGKTLLTLHFSWWTFDFLGFLRKKYWFIGQAIKIGEKTVRKCFQEMIELITQEGIESFGDIPCVIGETGIPFNLDNNEAFRTGDYSNQVRAMDATLNATEQAGNLSVLWNYVPDNTHSDGDLWNREDLSIFCKETIYPQSNNGKFQLFRLPLDKGGRALEAVIRPYAMFTPGAPIVQAFTLPHYSPSNVPSFQFTFRAFGSQFQEGKSTSDKVLSKCEIFLPPHQFPPGQELRVHVTEGVWEVVRRPLNPEAPLNSQENDEPLLQTLIWSFDYPLETNALYTIQITYAGADFPAEVVNGASSSLWNLC